MPSYDVGTLHVCYWFVLVNVPVVGGCSFHRVVKVVDVNYDECTASDHIISIRTFLELRERGGGGQDVCREAQKEE